MNAYTTIEESKQLIEAGLDVNTADMFYYRRPTGKSKYGVFPDFKPEGRLEVFTKVDLPCWSLAALLNIIDSNNLVYDISNEKNREFEALVYSADYIEQELKFYHNEHSIVDMIIWLLKNNYIKSNKNE